MDSCITESKRRTLSLFRLNDHGAIYHNDCMEVLQSVNDASIDLIATDPPYEIGYNGNAWDKENTLQWHVLSKHFHRILKPSGALVLFQGWSNVAETKAVLDKAFFLKNWIIYDRIKGRGAVTNVVSTREDILWYVKDENNYTYNKVSSNILKKTGGSIGTRNGNPYRALSNVWTDISPIVPWSKEKVAHPTQKPLPLMRRIVDLFSNEGDAVLDCFMGSGTTCKASQLLNRKYIGIEKHQAYFETAKTRLNQNNECNSMALN